jgi:hypothetical protein
MVGSNMGEPRPQEEVGKGGKASLVVVGDR